MTPQIAILLELIKLGEQVYARIEKSRNVDSSKLTQAEILERLTAINIPDALVALGLKAPTEP